MADPTQPDIISRPGAKAGAGAEGGAAGFISKFRSLPKQGQIGIVAAVVVGFLWLFSGSHNSGQQNGASPTMGTLSRNPNDPSSTEPFTGLESDRPAVMQSVYEQNRRDMAEMRGKIEDSFQQRDRALQDALGQNQELQRQMTQMMSDFTAEIKNLQSERAKDAERLAQLADQQHQMELNAPVDGSSGNSPVGGRKQRINQVTLGGGGVGGPKALLSPLGGTNSAGGNVPGSSQGSGAHLPFIPPLGFIKATLLNGVDALVGGQPTPALARIQGVYKTAMGGTVTLDGCFVMIEFNGNISTERAVGKPTRMTCVYPDGGAATYALSGYIVDAEDGIIGVPGMLYEGDPTRIAGAMLADFAAGVGEILAQNQNTNTVDSNGTTKTTLTGSQATAQVAGGVDKAMSSLKQYLLERVNRVQPFIRIDSTRDIHLVILNGTELRDEGAPWSLLFDSQASDRSRAQGVPANANQATGQSQQGAPQQQQQQ